MDKLLKTRSAPCSILAATEQEFAIYRDTKLGTQISAKITKKPENFTTSV